MDTRRVAVSAAVVGLAGFVVQYAPSRLVNQWLQGGSTTLPTFGTTGQTVVTYHLLAGAIGPIATVLLSVWLGYRLGDRLDLSLEYRRFGRAVAAGAVASAVVGWAAMALTGGLPSVGPAGAHALITLAVLVRLLAVVSLVVTVGVFAGAALSHFRKNDESPARPTGADAPVHEQ